MHTNCKLRANIYPETQILLTQNHYPYISCRKVISNWFIFSFPWIIPYHEFVIRLDEDDFQKDPHGCLDAIKIMFNEEKRRGTAKIILTFPYGNLRLFIPFCFRLPSQYAAMEVILDIWDERGFIFRRIKGLALSVELCFSSFDNPLL